MNRRITSLPPGCPAFAVLFLFLFLIPFFFAQLLVTALARLGLPSELALLALIGIFLGGALNIPVKKVEREREVVGDPLLLYGFNRLLPRLGLGPLIPIVRQRTRMVIAVNLGGCVIPCAIAAYEIVRVVSRGPLPAAILVGVTALNVLVCYRVAQPVQGVGIAMPALVPPIVAALPSLLLIPDFAPPVAFTAGVLGPLVGADLLHLGELKESPTGMASIGGAGTFDGIVLSGMFAALLA